jgi:hypothetical protein
VDFSFCGWYLMINMLNSYLGFALFSFLTKFYLLKKIFKLGNLFLQPLWSRNSSLANCLVIHTCENQICQLVVYVGLVV